MQDYTSRLRIHPVNGDSTTCFYTGSGTHVATGYKRVVIGKRGPYIEFDFDQLSNPVWSMPPSETWRVGSSTAYYAELRSIDESNVKCYMQKKVVDYADYVVGMTYVSPFDLFDEHGVPMIDALQK